MSNDTLSEADFDETRLSDDDLLAFIKRYRNNPVLFAQEICQLDVDEPQINILNAVISNKYLGVSAGHGIGKSFMTGVLILWWMSTRPDCRVIVTANTQDQVMSKTWSSLAQVLNNSLNKSWFEYTATKLVKKGADSTWFAKVATWTDNNFESFAGTHAYSVLQIFDEASSIPSGLFDVAEGAMTTPDCKMVMFGNPTRTTGYFFDKLSNETKWKALYIDARTSKWTSKQQHDEWLEEHGEDSDFFRVRVRGLFPRSGSSTFLPIGLVNVSKTRVKNQSITSPVKVLGIDVANAENSSNDAMVLTIRIGDYIHSTLSDNINRENVDTVVKNLDKIHDFNWIICDSTGHGSYFHKQFKHLPKIYDKIITVVANELSKDLRYANKTTESFGRVKEWLERGGILPNDSELIEDITSREFSYDNKGRYKVDSKTLAKKALGRSPDRGDSFCLTMLNPGDLFTAENKNITAIKSQEFNIRFNKISEDAGWAND